MSKILASRVKTHIETAVVETLDLTDCPGEESKALSRGLVSICISSISGLPYKDAAKYVTDSYKDNGIDGCFYDANKNKLFLIQSKWSAAGTKTIETGDTHKFLKGVYDLLDQKWKLFNGKFASISAEIEAGLKNDPQIVLVVAYNSDNNLSDDCKRLFDKFLAENNSDDQEVVSYSVFDLTKIIRTIKASKTGAKADVDLSLLDWGENKSPYYSVYGRVSCADVAEWHKAHGELLFSENIRYTLKNSEINEKISESLKKKPESFWYLNNGLTAICDEFKRKPVGLGDQKESSLWTVSNIKIVNGAQTTSAIATAYRESAKSVRKAYVQLRLIALSKAPLDIGGQITTATNTQNRVEPRDFLALDTTQDGLAESFRKIGVQYCFRRGEVVSNPKKGFDVQGLAMALAATSDNMQDVVVAKRNAGSLTDPNGYYPRLFASLLDVETLWSKYQLWVKAQQIVEHLANSNKDRARQLAIHGNRFIENHLVRFYPKKITTANAEKIHQALSDAIETNYKDCYLAVLFKNAQKCTHLSEELRKAGI